MKDIEFKNIKTGEFFTIGETPSYPKLKTIYGYIDVRDEIKKQADEVSEEWGFRIMPIEEVLEQFKQYGYETIEDIEEEKEIMLLK